MNHLSDHLTPINTTQQEQSALILRLPLELLQLIFEFSLPHCRSSDLVTSRDVHQNFDAASPPWTISHVRRHWRLVSSSHPRLWSSFKVVGQHQSPSKGRLELLARRIQFSNGEDLHIVLRQRTSVIYFLPLFDLVSGVSHRISSIEFDFEDSTHPALIHWYQGLLRTPYAFQSLTTLALHLHELQPTNRTHILILQEARLLMSLSIKNHFNVFSSFQEELRRWNIPWTQLTHLHLDSLPWNIIINILKTTSHLHYLSTQGTSSYRWYFPEGPSRPERVTLPYLRSLCVRDDRKGEEMLNYIATPSLNEIDTETPWSSPRYTRMLAFAPQITKWTWMHPANIGRIIEQEEIIRLLHAISTSLEVFAFHMTSPISCLPHLLTAISSLDALRRLEMHGLSLQLDTVGGVEMLYSLSQKSQSCLESAVVWFEVRDEGKDSAEVWADLCSSLCDVKLRGVRLWGLHHSDIMYRWPLNTDRM